MKQFIITIPENKAGFFIELMKNISFVKSIRENFSEEIPAEHISTVRERVEKYKNNPEDYMNLDELENKLNFEK
ncbi:MAG TPA: hypothetical protein VJ919_15645 [Tangfeifania sp.]|nr:hypothetical protein [Tangfeifania sp.]